MRILAVVSAGFLCVTLAWHAQAQVSSALILLPWEDGRQLSAANSAQLGYDGKASDGGADVELSRFISVGRARTGTERDALSMGWAVSQLEIKTDDAALPERLSAQEVALGSMLGVWDGWQVSGTLGVGYAGNTPWNDGDAWHGLASLTASRRLESGAILTLLVDYDGNRNIFPDIPLPGFTYAQRYNEQVSYMLGLPINSITWTPDDKWTLTGRWIVPLGVSLDVDYALTEQVSLFAGYRKDTTGYHIQNDDKHRRLFFEQSRAEVGARWGFIPQATLVGAVGYAFDQSFERGFDSRDTDNVRDISDEFYFRLGVNLSF